MRIDRSDLTDGPGDAHMDQRALSAPDDPDTAGKDKGAAVSGDGSDDSSPACPDSALLTERSVAYHAVVAAVYRRYAIDNGYTPVEKPEREIVAPAMRYIEAEDRLKGKGRPAEVADLKKCEAPKAADDTTALARDGSAASDHDGWVRDHSGDVPDDPRNYNNPKTGRFDSSWSTYDRAITAAREHTGGDLGPDSIKMYDYNPRTGEGTGTLIAEQTPDRLRGWRIDSQDGHVNWWEGKTVDPPGRGPGNRLPHGHMP